MASQIDRLKERIEKKIDKFLKKLEKDIGTIIYNRAPWSTSELREDGITIATRQDSYLNYTLMAVVGTGVHKDSSMTYEQLTKRLEVGTYWAAGVEYLYLRTRDSAGGKNEMRTATKGWWTESIQDIKKYIKTL